MSDLLSQNEQNSKTEFPSLFTWTSESVFEPEVQGSEEVNAYHLSLFKWLDNSEPTEQQSAKDERPQKVDPEEIAQIIFETQKPYSCDSVDQAEDVRVSLLDLLKIKGLSNTYYAGYQIEGDHVWLWKK